MSVADVIGVWRAHRRFGPDISGDLTIRDVKGNRIAEIAGSVAPVRRDGDGVLVEWADAQGRFRGRLRGARIVGHWVQPATVGDGCAYATPVVLYPMGPDRWCGRVTPVDDVTTFYLPIGPAADGRLAAFLRNPERNAGLWLHVEHVEAEGRRVKLLGRHLPDAVGVPTVDSGDTEAVIAEGSLDLEHRRLSFHFADHGGRFEFRHVTEADDDGFRPRGREPARYSYTPPVVSDDAWPVGTLDEVGIDHDTIVRFVQMLIDTPIDSVHAPEIHGVLIARHGRLVLEEYFHGFARDDLHDTRSAAKSLASVLTGAAIRQGAPITLSTAVCDTMGDLVAQIDLDPWKRALTVEHLMTMSSGLDSDDWDASSRGSEELMQTQTGQPDWHRFALGLDMMRPPGEQAVYSAATCNLLGGVLTRATGRWLPALFHDLIAEPLDIGHYAMNLMPSGEAYLGGGVRFRPRDFMKFGQLMLDGGGWRGRQVVDRDWAQQSITKRYELNRIGYGFLWWIIEYPHQERTTQAFFAGGNGGQIVMGLPELDLVIAFYGGNYSDRATYLAQRVYVPEHILPAIMH